MATVLKLNTHYDEKKIAVNDFMCLEQKAVAF